MKAVFTIIIAIIATVNVFANNGGNGTRPSVATKVASTEATMSSEMEAALMAVISNQTATTVATTTDNAVKMTVATATETIVTNNFATHRFVENTTSNDIAPAAVTVETIELEAEGL
jgi:hypothetical protein